MNPRLARGFRGFALASAAACLAGCVIDDYTGPAITLTGGYQGLSLGVTLGGRAPRQPNPVEEAAALLAIKGLPAEDAKQPITSDK